MSATTNTIDRLHKILTQPSNGIAGLVDELLPACQGCDVHFEWWDGRCAVAVGGEGSADIPLRQSVFRAILARIAVLCNQQRPDPVSPYGGKGKISINHPPATIHVVFTNTPDVQRLALVTINGDEQANE